MKRLHANELGVARLTTVAEKLTRFSKKNDLRFSMLKVKKPDHALICFFDQVLPAKQEVEDIIDQTLADDLKGMQGTIGQSRQAVLTLASAGLDPSQVGGSRC